MSVDVALETGRGLLVSAVRAAGHRVFEINPKASSPLPGPVRELYDEQKAWAPHQPADNAA